MGCIGLNHVAFATSDMDMTVTYWRDLLPGKWPAVEHPFTEDEKVVLPGEGIETFGP